MAHLFASYERDFADLSKEIQDKIAHIRSDSSMCLFVSLFVFFSLPFSFLTFLGARREIQRGF